MCKACQRNKAAGLPPLDHTPGPIPTLEDREAEMRERVKARAPVISAHYADPSVRRARLRYIRLKTRMTVNEFSRQLGVSQSYYCRLEYGQRSPTMVHLKLAERIFRAWREVQKRKEKRQQAAAGIPQLAPPDDPKLHAEAVMLLIRGVPRDEVARQLALRPEVIDMWAADIA